MKFASIYLENYIGIYNGMGLDSIFINFDIGTHRTVIIRGDNGSGKSTIMKAISVFPDSNDQFIPGRPAKKEINLRDGNTIYTLTFIHGIKSNGNRDITKAYIVKTEPNGVSIPLNENGNVSSYRDIIFNELGLDPNFESLSQLSTDDRGIADKKPADRKRFVNSILNNLEVYNDIYKTLSKRSSSLKNLISSISTKLSMIGDPNNIITSVAGIESMINDIQDKKDRAIARLAEAKAKMQLIDPDGSINSLIVKIQEDSEKYQASIDAISKTIASQRLGCGISLTEDISGLITHITDRINALNVDNQIHRGELESYLKSRERDASELSNRVLKLQSFEQEWGYEDICDRITTTEKELNDIIQTITSTGIRMEDITSFSKDSYIIALESIKKIIDSVSDIKDQSNYEILIGVVEEYYTSGTLSQNMDIILDSQAKINEYEKQLEEIDRLLAVREREKDIMGSLSHRPDKCNIDDCYFIKEAVAIFNQDPHPTLEELLGMREDTKSTLETLKTRIAIQLEYNACISRILNLARDIDRNQSIVSKLACGDIFKDKPKLILDIFLNNYQEVLETIYSHLDIANLFDIYKTFTESLVRLNADKSIYESKIDMIDEIQASIQALNKSLEGIAEQIKVIQAKLASNDKTLIELQKSLGAYQSIANNELEKSRLEKLLQDSKNLYQSNIDKINEYNNADREAKQSASYIEVCAREIAPLMNERDNLNHQMRLADDYKKELDQLNMHYDILEKIRYYSSPTTGIQLVFMEMYIGKIIDMANQLLVMFFNGQFKIMPFIINESEFRIPCAGEGILNDDISSMSSAQIAMISMILSFSFLYSASSRYNILKLDEIDAPLDSNNRVMFIDVLNKVMDMMGTEQCIMISHNSELQVDDADLILLKTSEQIIYPMGNIIWKY